MWAFVYILYRLIFLNKNNEISREKSGEFAPNLSRLRCLGENLPFVHPEIRSCWRSAASYPLQILVASVLNLHLGETVSLPSQSYFRKRRLRDVEIARIRFHVSALQLGRPHRRCHDAKMKIERPNKSTSTRDQLFRTRFIHPFLPPVSLPR